MNSWTFRNLNLVYNCISKITTAFQLLTLVSVWAILHMLQYKYQFLGFQAHMISKRVIKYFQISQEFAYIIIYL